MGFLGTGSGIGKLFGKRLSRYSGLMVLGILNPPLMDSILQWLTGVEPGGVSLVDKETTVTPTPIPSAVPCLEFNGVDGVIALPATTIDFYSAAFTFTCWMEVAAGSGEVHIYSSTYATGSNRCVVLYDRTANTLLAGHWDGSFHGYKINGAIANGTFFKFTWVHQASGAGDDLYVNDILQSKAADSFFSTTGTIGRYIGALTAGNSNFEGKVAQIGFVDNDFYTLEETSGTTALDSSDKGNDGTHSGGVTHTTADGIPCKGLELGFTDAGTYTSYDILLISEDLKLVANPRLLDGGGAGYHANADEPQVSTTAPSAHRTSLSGKGYTFTNEGAIL